MQYLVYDHTFYGWLTAVFEVYERKLTKAAICNDEHAVPGLFSEKITVHTDNEKAKRVLVKLKQLLGAEVQLLWKVWLSELPDIENAMLGMVQYAISENANVLPDYGHPDVLTVQQTAKMVHREKHRMEAFVRFQRTKDDLYFATVAPDYNVLPLIAPHFASRFADQRWMIYDTRRSYGIYYDLTSVSEITLDVRPDTDIEKPGDIVLEESESLYQQLWKDYFKNTNIPARKNMKLHLQHVPRRYWKYLVEKR